MESDANQEIVYEFVIPTAARVPDSRLFEAASLELVSETSFSDPDESEQKRADSFVRKLLSHVVYEKEGCVGQYGKPFTTWKVRTMVHGADELLDGLIEQYGRNGRGQIPNDPRVTGLGKILRPLHLDEFPQLWSLLVDGTMGFVGIRPKTSEEWKAYHEDIRNGAMEYKPGCFPITFADWECVAHIGTEGHHMDVHRRYLEDKKNNPNADIIYFRKGIENILKYFAMMSIQFIKKGAHAAYSKIVNRGRTPSEEQASQLE